MQVFTRGTPDAGLLAVTEAHPRQRVVAATAAARVLGVETGGSVAGALAIAPALQLRARQPALESATLEELATWAERFTPHLSIDPPDAVLLEVAASLRLFGGPMALATAIRDALAELGLHAGIAAAPTPLAARWLARHRPGAIVLHHPGWQDELADLPLTALAEAGVPPDSLVLLHGIGARTLADVLHLPRAGLARRQASAVIDTLARARAEQADPRPWFSAPLHYHARLAMPTPSDNTEPLLFAARRLFAGLAAWLSTRQCAVDHCRLSLEHESAPPTVLDIVTGSPTRDESRLGLLARERLAALPLPAPVDALRLDSGLPVGLAPKSGDLFGDPDSARENAALLFERLRARLGNSAVLGLRAYPDHRPERAWRPAPPGRRPPRPTSPPSGQQRPLWLLAEPTPLPRHTRLTLLAGPERIESGWWDGDEVRRDYYIAQDHTAALCWIFRAHAAPEQWYLHGYFG